MHIILKRKMFLRCKVKYFCSENFKVKCFAVFKMKKKCFENAESKCFHYLIFGSSKAFFTLI